MTVITREREKEWHKRIADGPHLASLLDVQSRLDEATLRFRGPSGMAAFDPGARIEANHPQSFAALSASVYVGETKLTRALVSECRVTYGRDRAGAGFPTPAELLDSDELMLTIQYSGHSDVEPRLGDLATKPGTGRYASSNFKHTTTYSDLADIMLVTTPISRVPELADGLCTKPAQRFPGSAVDAAMFSYLSQFLFRRLVGPKRNLESESQAENAVISVIRSAMAPLVENQRDVRDIPLKHRLDQEIELHHRDPDFTVDSLAALLGLSRRQLYRVAGDGVAARLREARCKTARELIQAEPGLELTLVARLSGFSDSNRLRDQFVRTFSILPSTYREDIRRRASKDNHHGA